ncbi:MAG: nucleoside triphosphate pyrophosphohydrolase [Acidimicrobiia bacterium]|nr:nucleoside triphosphate pyrophosphohydrolase [Acidimicrobiia bacterium]
MPPTVPVVTVVGLGPAGAELLTAETLALLEGESPVWLRTARHPAAAGLTPAGSFDSIYETADSFEDVYRTIVERLVVEAEEHRHVVYAVPGSPTVAEHTVELLRAESRIEIDVRSALSFTDLCWVALGIDPMAMAVTIVDAHRIHADTAGRLGPLLVTQVHSSEILDEVILALDDAVSGPVTILKGLGTSEAVVEEIAWSELGTTLDPDHLTSLWIPTVGEPVAAAFVELDELVRRLRADCPWDAEQTHASLRRFLLEETYEVLEAIDGLQHDSDHGYLALEEELGDLLFQVFFHSRLAAEQGRFVVADVAQGIHDKLVARHPHVFADADPEATVAGWELAKQAEKGRESVMDGLPVALPALLHALKTQKRAAATGFSGPDIAWALGDVRDELQEVIDDPSEHEVGDLLYAAVQVARMLDVDPEQALRHASNRFADRFRLVESGAIADGVELNELEQVELRDRWERAKEVLADTSHTDD